MSSLSGWYYDLYQNIMDPTEEDPEKTGINRLTTISLHANSVYISKDNWAYSEIANNRDKMVHQRDLDPNIGEMYDEDGYFYKPICTAVLQEDFQVTVQNQWSDMGDDKLGGFVNSLRANLAPFAGTVSEGLQKMVHSQQELIDSMSDEEKNSVTGQIITSLAWMADKANGLVNGEGKDNSNHGEGRAAKYLNSALLINGSRFSIYQGSNLNFNNMGMRFTVIPKWDPETGVFITVPQQLRDMYMYFFGEYLQMDDILKDEDFFVEAESSTKKEGDKKDGKKQDRSEILSRITWQRPPGGYQADMSQLDAVQKGSLKLKIGGLYTICNVVVESASLTFSKQMVKNPRATFDTLMGNDQIGGSDYLTPLSCDVNLMLRPCTRYSDQTFKSIIEGAGMQKEKEDLAKLLVDNIKHGMEDYIKSSPSYLVYPYDNFDYKKQYNPLISEEVQRQKQLQEELKRQQEELERQQEEERKRLLQQDIDESLANPEVYEGMEEEQKKLNEMYIQNGWDPETLKAMRARGASEEYLLAEALKALRIN